MIIKVILFYFINEMWLKFVMFSLVFFSEIVIEFVFVKYEGKNFKLIRIVLIFFFILLKMF